MCRGRVQGHSVSQEPQLPSLASIQCYLHCNTCALVCFCSGLGLARLQDLHLSPNSKGHWVNKHLLTQLCGPMTPTASEAGMAAHNATPRCYNMLWWPWLPRWQACMQGAGADVGLHAHSAFECQVSNNTFGHDNSSEKLRRTRPGPSRHPHMLTYHWVKFGAKLSGCITHAIRAFDHRSHFVQNLM